MERAKAITDIIIIFIIAAIIILWNLGTGSLTSWDEGVYGHVAQEILKSNNWIDLRFAGVPWSDKPPLCMWAIALSYKLFGVNEFSVRLFSALCAIGTVIVTYFLAAKLYSRRIAFASALTLVSIQHFIWAAKVGMLDSAFTFFVTLSVFLFKLGEEKKICLFLSPLSFACAFLTKGVGAFLVVAILGPYLLATKKIKILKEPFLIWGILISLGILIWWHGLAFLHYGQEFIRDYFKKHLLMRTTQAVEGHSGSLYTYFKVLPNKGRPWAVFGFLVLPIAIWRIFAKKEKEHILVVWWFIIVFVLFSLVQTKLHWYIIPIYPALSILVGWAMSKLFRRYSTAIVLILVIPALIYLATLKKGIFNLDYSPDTKKMFLSVSNIIPEGEKIFMYKIDDPGVLFYFYGISKNIWQPEDLEDILGQKDKYILFTKPGFNDLTQRNFTVIYDNPSFIVVKTR